MANVLACRACLCVDVKLHPIQGCALDTPFQTVSQLLDSSNDLLPQYICTFCRALLKRCVDFHRQCQSTQEAVRDLIGQHGELTTDLLKSMDWKPTQQLLKLKTSHVEVISCDEDSEMDQIIVKQEVETIFVDIPIINDDVKSDDGDKWEGECANADADDDDKLEGTSTPDLQPRARRAKVAARLSDATVKEQMRRAALNENVESIVLTHEEKLAAMGARAAAAAYRAARHKCELCYEGFVTPAALRNHMTRHDPAAGAHLCVYCRKYYPTATRLRKHRALQHDRRYLCRRCGREDRTKKLAFNHQQWHLGVRVECDTCGASYKHKMNILRHIARAHPGQLSRDLLASTGRKPVCRACRLTFFSPAAFAQHQRTSSRHTGVGEDTYHCRECGASFPRRGALLTHARAAHPASGDVVECEQCGKVCYVTEYPRHARRAHPGALPYKYRRHGGSLECICEVCGRKCGNKYVLRTHLMTHTGERPFQCRFCPKRKISKEQLKNHERWHTGERPYACSQCPKAFCDAPALKRHLLVHTGEKPYACSYCGKCFSQSNSMKLHVTTVHHKLPTPYKRKPRTKKAAK